MRDEAAKICKSLFGLRLPEHRFPAAALLVRAYSGVIEFWRQTRDLPHEPNEALGVNAIRSWDIPMQILKVKR